MNTESVNDRTPSEAPNLPVDGPNLVVSGNGWNAQRWYEYEGARYPTVTSILKAINKPALVGWAAKAVAEYAAANYKMVAALASEDPAAAIDLLKGSPYRDRDKAANLGSRVHRLLETGGVGADDEERPFVEAWGRWVEATGTEVIAQEIPVVNTVLGYGGTVDLIARANGITGLLDIKTGKTVADRDGKPYPEIALQIAAYCAADVGLPVPVESAAVLHVRPEGVKVYKVELAGAIEVFAAVKQLAEYLGIIKIGGDSE